MDNIDERYKRGKIYTIRCRYDNNLIYVGSTIQPLSKRIGLHRTSKNCSLFQYVDGDWDNWYIELYEEYPCNNKYCLEKREGEVIRLIGNINKCIAGRTDKEYYNDNKEKLLEYQKEYNEENKEKINEQKKIYYENNKDKIQKYNEENREKIAEQRKKHYENNRDKLLEIKREYYEDNKDKIEEKKAEKIECDKCKSIVRRCYISKHKKTKKCLNYTS